VKIGSAVRPGRVPVKKRTGQDRTRRDRTQQDRTRQDSQKKWQCGNISHIWEEAPTVPITTKICMVGSLPDKITCTKFEVKIFGGYDFPGGGRISHFLLIFEWALQQCSATALPVMRKRSPLAYAGGASQKADFGA